MAPPRRCLLPLTVAVAAIAVLRSTAFCWISGPTLTLSRRPSSLSQVCRQVPRVLLCGEGLECYLFWQELHVSHTLVPTGR